MFELQNILPALTAKVNNMKLYFELKKYYGGLLPE